MPIKHATMVLVEWHQPVGSDNLIDIRYDYCVRVRQVLRTFETLLLLFKLATTLRTLAAAVAMPYL